MNKNVELFTRKFEAPEYLTGIVTVPSDRKAGEKLPLILFLHGAGEVGDSTPETVERVTVHGIPKYFSRNPDHKGLRVITASPQCPAGLRWENITLQLLAWLDDVIEKYGADASRVSVTGLSMGGFGTWDLLDICPERFQCAAPVCGGGFPWHFDKEKIKNKKIRVYHSIDDGVVPYECSVSMVKGVKMMGADVEFFTYQNEGHGCWNAAYGDTDLIEWLAYGGNISE